MTVRSAKRGWKQGLGSLPRPDREKRRWKRLSPQDRREVVRLRAAGLSVSEIVARLDSTSGTVYGVLAPCGGVFRAGVWQPSARYLSLEDRCTIAVGLGAGESYRRIGERLGRAASTVKREVDRNGGRARYAPADAHERAHQQARRAKPSKLSTNPRLLGEVVKRLERFDSPEQISGRLRLEHPNDSSMWVSHETIYKSLFVQGRGELRNELIRCLRSGRAARKPRRPATRGGIPDKVMITERPAEIEDRALPGHHEGDLIIGARNASAVGTLVERSTRYLTLVPLRDGYRAEQVRDALAAAVCAIPTDLMRSITWDQGSEMQHHAQFTVDTGIPVYFCEPYKPWQRGTNENTNGLIRQFLPKGTDLSQVTADELIAIQDNLNNRPRKSLGFRTPNEAFTELVASTD